jgi:hypothetical protein
MSWLRTSWIWVVPTAWVALSGAAYLATLWGLDRAGNLDTDASLSAAQVFTGVAGFGAGAVALFAVFRQLRPQRAEVRLRAEFNGSGGVRLWVRNDGPVPADTVLVTFRGAGSVQAPAGIEGWTTAGRSIAGTPLRYLQPLPPFSEEIEVSPSFISFPGSTTEIVASCINGSGNRIVVPHG